MNGHDTDSRRNHALRKIAPYLLALMAASCGGESKKDSDKGTAGNDPTPTSQPADTTSSFSLGGQLQLGTLGLSTTSPGVLLVKMDGKSQVKEFKELDVDADGKFSVSVDRKDAEATKAAEILANGGVNRALAKEVYPQYAAQIDAMSDDQIRDGLSQQIADAKQYGGYKYMLIAYDKEGDALAQAQSMQFIGLPLADGASLRMLPGEAVTGNLDLGSIAGSGDEAKATASAESALSVSGTFLKELASLSQTLKVVKNDWVNRATKPARLTPYFAFRTTGMAKISNQWSLPTDASYRGSGLYMGIQNIGATFGEVCPANPDDPSDVTGNNYTATPAKTVQWYPPANITMGSVSYGPDTPITNLLGSFRRSAQYDELSCSGSGMYSRAKTDSDTEFQLQLGQDLDGAMPAGFWKLSVDGTAKGYWDISAAKPLDENGKPVVYMPVLKAVLSDAGKVTRLDIKFYFFDKAANDYVAVSDVAGLRSTIHQLNLDGAYGSAVPHSGGDLSGKVVDNEDGTFSVTLSDADQAVLDCNANPSSMCFRSFGFSYLIGSVSYRLEVNQ